MKVDTIILWIMNKHKLLEDILTDLHQQPEFFETMLEHSGVSSRNIMQMYMVYKFKWNWSKDIGHDLGLDGALNKWVTDGYATHFANQYKEDVTIWSMYHKMLYYDRQRSDDYGKEESKGIYDGSNS